MNYEQLAMYKAERHKKKEEKNEMFEKSSQAVQSLQLNIGAVREMKSLTSPPVAVS